jgi:HD-GYP domain-containing protein (c-di-GMP phosphodiesterase class II)
MVQTQVLLEQIAALRKRLEENRNSRGINAGSEEASADGPGSAASSAQASSPMTPAARRREGIREDPVARLQTQVVRGQQEAEWLDYTLRQLPGPVAPPPLPAHLVSRARRLLPQIQELLQQLRQLAEDPLLAGEPVVGSLAAWHRQTVLLVELALRTLQTLPESPTIQLRWCEGVEVLLKEVRRRLAWLCNAVDERRRQQQQRETLARLLAALVQGQLAEPTPLLDMTEKLLAEVEEGQPLLLDGEVPSSALHFITQHALTVARVAARISRFLPEWQGRRLQVVLAALVQDAGMLTLDSAAWYHAGPLEEASRRLVEQHPERGADLLAVFGPEWVWLREAVRHHHERLDGTGYPAGLHAGQINPLARLLAVCDVYAAQCCPRPHRPARDTRTTLTDTLLLAQQGTLDHACAAALLELSLYPAGVAVELADGTLGVVVATHPGEQDLHRCARPVVALLTDRQGRPLPMPQYVDLAACRQRSIVRSLSGTERRQALGEVCPEWA